MTKLTCWTMALVGILLLPSVVVSADAAAEAYQKGKACLEKADVDSAIAAFTEATVQRKDTSMNRIALSLLTLGFSLAPILCWAAEPNADQAKAIAEIRELRGWMTPAGVAEL